MGTFVDFLKIEDQKVLEKPLSYRKVLTLNFLLSTLSILYFLNVKPENLCTRFVPWDLRITKTIYKQVHTILREKEWKRQFRDGHDA